MEQIIWPQDGSAVGVIQSTNQRGRSSFHSLATKSRRVVLMNVINWLFVTCVWSVI